MTRRRKSASDGGLVSAILDLCAAMGIEADRRNSGELNIQNKDGSYRKVMLCKPGTFDIFGYCKRRSLAATAFEIECKPTTGEKRKAQIRRAEMLTELGIPWIFARSIGQAKVFLEGLRNA